MEKLINYLSGRKGRALGAMVLVAAALPVSAHDFWLEPSMFRPAAGSFVTISLLVGENLQGELVARDRAGVERFVALHESAETPIDEGFVVPDANLIRVVYRSRPKPITLDAQKFEQYLREEGLERVIDLRAKRGQSSAEGREIFSRCAKSLLLPDKKSAAGADRASGLPLEIIAESNPYARKGTVSFVIRYQGKPLKGALVMALNNSKKPLRARSDRAGRVRFSIDSPGLWLIKSVHMIEAPKGSGAEWESLWASLTFEN